MYNSDKIISIHYKGGITNINIPVEYTDADVDDLINRFSSHFYDRQPKDIEDIEFIWCLVGNIVDKHLAGNVLGIKRGTKQFSPNTKVYCFPDRLGDGYEKFYVLGKPRKSHGLIKVIMQTKYIKNWRIQKIYDSHIISEMVNSFGWTGNEYDKETIENMLKLLPAKTVEELPLTEEEKKFPTSGILKRNL